MYALVMMREDSPSWEKGMVVEFRSDSIRPGTEERPPKFMIVQFPLDLPQSVVDEWMVPMYTGALDKHGISLMAARRRRKIDVDKLLNGRVLTSGEALSGSYTEIQNATLVVARKLISEPQLRMQ